MQGVRQKSTAGVSGIRRGHFFAVRRSRCPYICKRAGVLRVLQRNGKIPGSKDAQTFRRLKNTENNF